MSGEEYPKQSEHVAVPRDLLLAARVAAKIADLPSLHKELTTLLDDEVTR